MLRPLLATEDPYAAASIFSEAGWKVEYDSARDGDQLRACLASPFRIELVLPSDPYVVPRGLGIEFLIHVPPHELSGLFRFTAQPAWCSARCVSGDPASADSGQRSSATASPSWAATRTPIWHGRHRSTDHGASGRFASGMARLPDR